MKNDRYIIYDGRNSLHFVYNKKHTYYVFKSPESIVDFGSIMKFNSKNVEKAFNVVFKKQRLSEAEFNQRFKIINDEQLEIIKNEFVIKEIIT